MPARAKLALQSILGATGWHDAPTDRLSITPAPSVLPTVLPIGPVAAAALAATGLAAAALWQQRCARAQTIRVDTRAAALAMAGADFLRVDGERVTTWDPITGYFPVRDGRWVYLHGNFPHLRDGLLELLDVPNDRAAVARALAGWRAEDVESAAGERGLCAVMVRDRAMWGAHPQCRATAALPLVAVERIGDAPPMPLPDGPRPLSGVRVVDLSRVIAGPMIGRTLAEHGATVMLVSAPHLPSIESLVIDTGFGKLSASIDLRTSEGVAMLRRLVAQADVFNNAYRPGALDARGFSAQDLARERPGIVYVTESAFSRAGPWKDRRGYDSLVCAATGVTSIGQGSAPVRLPCQPLDYLVGYLGAFGAMVALLRRAREGGSWKVTLSLERTAAWLMEMTAVLGLEAAVPATAPTTDDVRDLCAETPSRFGHLTYLAPVVHLSETAGHWERAPVPLGADAPVWPAAA